MTQRTCGTCTACCKALPVAEIGKAAGRWCQHCNKGRGCRVYGTHPKGCQEFQCQWLLGSFTDTERPDTMRIVVDAVEYERIGTAILIYEMVRGELERDFAQDVLRRALGAGFTVVMVPAVDSPAQPVVYMSHEHHLDGSERFTDDVRGHVIRRFKRIGRGVLS